MIARNPRINIAIEKPVYTVIHDLAETEGIPISMVVRDLIKEALEIREDVALSRFAEEREETFDSSKALSHEQVWG